jgi:hypothetical protein
MATSSGALAQVYSGPPSSGGPYIYDYAPGYAGTYGYYGYAPGGWYGYGSFDESGNSVRQPNPRSTIRAVR